MYKTGDIFHCTGHGLVSKGISVFTKSKITHTAMFISIWGEDFIIEAQRKGVYTIPFKEWKDKWKYEYIVNRSPDVIDEKEIATKAVSKLGHTAYDFQSFLLRMPVKLITGKWRAKPNEDDKVFCSEFVAWCYKFTGSERLTPKELYSLTIELNFKTID